jgi:uncharacterized cupin superfamily protein
MSHQGIIRLDPNPPGFGDEPDALEAELFESAIPVQNSHEVYQDDDLGLYVGVWDTDDMVEAAGPYGMDEFMLLLEGEACIKNNKTGEMETVKAGQAFVIPRGYDCQWQQKGYLRKYFMISEHPAEEIPAQPAVEGIVVPREDATVEPLTSPEPFLMEGDTLPKALDFYVDSSGKFHSGTWQCAAFEAISRPFPYHQMFCVQEGAITLMDDRGEKHVFAAGDAFFVPEGVVCSGRSSTGVRLFYCVLHTH